MQTLPSWLAQFLEKANTLATLDGIAQLLIAGLGALAAWQAQRNWQKNLDARQAAGQSDGLMQTTLTGAARLILPLTLLLCVVAGRGLLKELRFDTLLLDVLVPLLVSLAGVRLAIYLLKTALGPNRSIKAWENSITLSAWTLAALYLLGWLPAVSRALDALALDVGETHISLLLVIKLAFSLGTLVLAAMWAGRAIERKLESLPNLDATLKVALAKISKVTLAALAILIALRAVGIDLTALAVLGGAFGVGLGFGLQRIAANLVSGFILLFERSIRPGDLISIGEKLGTVKQLHARYIVVKSRDGSETLIPNENVISSPVTNWSYTDRSVRVTIPIQISYNDDPEHAMSLLLEAAQNSDRVLKKPAPVAQLSGFGENGIHLELRLWLDDPEEGIASVKSAVNLSVWRLFKQHGITIPYPQREVRLIEPPPSHN